MAATIEVAYATVQMFPVGKLDAWRDDRPPFNFVDIIAGQVTSIPKFLRCLPFHTKGKRIILYNSIEFQWHKDTE
jgi:hypothetical protein